jgi:hypothetical protein
MFSLILFFSLFARHPHIVFDAATFTMPRRCCHAIASFCRHIFAGAISRRFFSAPPLIILPLSLMPLSPAPFFRHIAALFATMLTPRCRFRHTPIRHFRHTADADAIDAMTLRHYYYYR